MSNDDLFHLSYISTQTQVLTQDQMLELLEQARSINMDRDITGLLLHKGDSFFQVLEGPQDQVLKTYASIMKDGRHTDVETLLTGNISHREFTDWHMGFLNLSGIDTSTLQGYSDFMEVDTDSRKTLRDLGKGERLALLFKNMGNTF